MIDPNTEDTISHIVRTIRSYDEFYNLTYYSLLEAEKSVEGRFYNCLITMVFCAFSLEAYLNHLGERYISNWESLERNLNYSQKLTLIAKTTRIKIDMLEKPFCFMNSIFDYRKVIVHGKTSQLTKEQIINPNTIPEMPLAFWEKMTTLQKARDFRKHTEDIIKSLSKIIEDDDFPLGSPSEAIWN
jgi:hypothetical protein